MRAANRANGDETGNLFAHATSLSWLTCWSTVRFNARLKRRRTRGWLCCRRYLTPVNFVCHLLEQVGFEYIFTVYNDRKAGFQGLET